MLTMKKGDLLPALSITCTSNGSAVDLTTADSVTVIGKYEGASATLFERVVTGDVNGVVTMPWGTGDTDTVGRILISVAVVTGGKTQHFPASSYLAVDVEDTLE